jgi:hypothetical protein
MPELPAMFAQHQPQPDGTWTPPPRAGVSAPRRSPEEVAAIGYHGLRAVARLATIAADMLKEAGYDG